MSKSIESRINKVVEEYFSTNENVEWVPIKALMPLMVKEGVFQKDVKKGLPLRKVLRELDKNNKLDKIPLIHPERKEKHVYWYFVREGGKYTPKEPEVEITNKQKAKNKRESSDEYYIIGLINELLDAKASHQHTFKFLLGDYHKNGKTRTELPIDAYYRDVNLAIELIKEGDSKYADGKKTISGVSRAEQRELYRQRKVSVLHANDINLIEIEYASFDNDKDNKLKRDKEKDLSVLKGILKFYLK